MFHDIIWVDHRSDYLLIDFVVGKAVSVMPWLFCYIWCSQQKAYKIWLTILKMFAIVLKYSRDKMYHLITKAYGTIKNFLISLKSSN